MQYLPLIAFSPVAEELLQVSQAMSQVTPLEVEILFVLVDLLKQTGYAYGPTYVLCVLILNSPLSPLLSRRITYADLQRIAPDHYTKTISQRIALSLPLASVTLKCFSSISKV